MGILLYRDAEGNVTERRIRVLESYGGRNGFRYIKAFCHLKGEERTFRADRVVSFIPDSVPVAERAVPRRQPPSVPVYASSCGTSAPAFFPPPGAEAVPAAALPAVPAARTESSVLDAAPRVLDAAPRVLDAIRRPAGRKPERDLVSLIFGAVSWLIGKAYLLMLVLFFASSLLRGTAALSGRNSYVPLPRYLPAAAVQVSRPVPASRPVPPSPAPRKLTAEEARAVDFAKATGIADRRLLRRYEAADRNGDGGLSWEEIASFQKDLKQEFAYLHNATALRPDEFLKRGGGDCEDWALVTCGLLRYWGIGSYVGIFGRPDGSEGHAVCMVWVPERPGDATSYEARGTRTSQGTQVKDGFYVPVDYEVVGGLSNAVVPGAVFRGYWAPERLYGTAM